MVYFSSNTFRSGNIKDKITICTGYYYEKYTWYHCDVIKCMNYLNKIFVDKELCSYFIESTAECISGHRKVNTANIRIGKGCNSKSTICSLLKKLLIIIANLFHIQQ